MNYTIYTSFGFLLGRAHRQFRNVLMERLRKYNITPMQWAIIMALSENEGLCLADIAETIYRDKPNVVRMLEKLENKNLVCRKYNEQDSRSYFVYLTPEGALLKKEIAPVVLGMTDEALQGFQPEEIETMKNALTRVYKNLC